MRAGHRRAPERPRIGFVECNPVDLKYFARLVRTAVDVPVTPILLAELPRRPESIDLLATTFFHVEEVRRRCPGVEVVGLMALPDFMTAEFKAGFDVSRDGLVVLPEVDGVPSDGLSMTVPLSPGARRSRRRAMIAAAASLVLSTIAFSTIGCSTRLGTHASWTSRGVSIRMTSRSPKPSVTPGIYQLASGSAG